MADTLVERVTGQSAALQTPVEIQLLMTEDALLGDPPTAAELTGYGWPRSTPTVACSSTPVDLP